MVSIPPRDDASERELRQLLALGRYREILDRFPPDRLEPGSASPGVALSVASAATRLGRFAAGRRLASGALTEYRRRADDDGRMRCRNLLGAIAYERGQFDAAVDHFGAALEIGRALPDLLGWARAANNLASVTLLRGEIDAARRGYLETRVAYQRLGDRRGLAEAFHNLATVERELGRLVEAAAAAEHAVEHATVVADPSLLALALTGHAEAAVALGQYEVAAERLQRAEHFARQADDDLGVVDINRVRAERWLRLDRPDQALTVAESARSTARQLGSAQLQGECAALAADSLDRLGYPARAATRRAEARRIFTRLGALLLLRRLG